MDTVDYGIINSFFIKGSDKKYFNKIDFNKIKIVKTNNNVSADISVFPSYIKATKEELKSQFEKKVRRFAVTMTKNCPNTDLNYFKKNFETANFELDNKKGVSCGGEYNTQYNTINLYDFSSIYHELMHMASSYVNGDYLHSGFSVNNASKRLKAANMFNEGYTQLMAERYFNSKTGSYHDQVEIAKQIENIVGRDLMENLYFSADFDGLINELSKYETADNVKNFLKTLDIQADCYNPLYLDLVKAGKCAGVIKKFIDSCNKNKDIINSQGGRKI